MPARATTAAAREEETGLEETEAWRAARREVCIESMVAAILEVVGECVGRGGRGERGRGRGSRGG